MAKTTIGAEVEIEFKSLGQLKEAISDASAEFKKMVDKFGEGSEQAALAQQKMLKIQEVINKKTEAYNERVDNAAKTVSALNATVGGLQGALELTGLASDETSKALAKVTAALSVGDAIQNLAEFKGSIISTFNMLKTQVTSSNILLKANAVTTNLASGAMKMFGVSVNTTSTSFKVLRGAIAATGIGALVIAIGYAVDALMNLADSSDEAAKAEKEFENQQKRTEEAIKLKNKALQESIEFTDEAAQIAIKRAKAEGKSESDIEKIQRDALQKKIDLRKKDLESLDTSSQEFFEKKKEYGKAINDLENFDLDQQVKRREELTKKQESKTEKANQKQKELNDKKIAAQKIIDDAQLSLLGERQKAEEQILQQFEERKKALQEAGIKNFTDIEKQRDAELKALRDGFNEEDLQKAKDFQDQYNSIISERKINSIKDDREKEKEQLNQKYEEERVSVQENEKLSFEQRFLLLAQLKESERLELQAMDEKFAMEDEEKKIVKLEKEFEEEQTSFARKKEILDAEEAIFKEQLNNKQITEEEYNANVADLSEKRIKIAEAEGNARMQIAESVAGTLSQMAKMAGEETEEGKALAIAAATIDTISAAVKAYKAGVDIPVIGMVMGPVNAALALAAGYANIDKIASVKVTGKGSASPVRASAPTSPAPTPTVVAQTLNTEAINKLGDQSARAYVLNSDIQNNEQRNAYLQRNARLG